MSMWVWVDEVGSLCLTLGSIYALHPPLVTLHVTAVRANAAEPRAALLLLHITHIGYMSV
jgi:hypothetical protein